MLDNGFLRNLKHWMKTVLFTILSWSLGFLSNLDTLRLFLNLSMKVPLFFVLLSPIKFHSCYWKIFLNSSLNMFKVYLNHFLCQHSPLAWIVPFFPWCLANQFIESKNILSSLCFAKLNNFHLSVISVQAGFAVFLLHMFLVSFQPALRLLPRTEHESSPAPLCSDIFLLLLITFQSPLLSIEDRYDIFACGGLYMV